MLLRAFSSSKNFNDTENYPDGFFESPEFSWEQANLLTIYGCAYIDLSLGLREPKCFLERSFIAFCKGEKDATNEHERTWQIYSLRAGLK